MINRTHLIVAPLFIASLSQLVVAKDPSALIVVISGFRSDASADQISRTARHGQGNSGMYQLTTDLARSGFETRFFNWNGTTAGRFATKKASGSDAIVASIRGTVANSKIETLVLVGHSWGGHTMLDVAEQLTDDPPVEIELAIGLDASSISRGERMKRLPHSIRKLVNYHSGNAFCWRAWPDDPRVENIDLGDPANGYVVDGKPNYAAMFDLQAHNAAEWDTKIHADIRKRIADAIAKPNRSTNQSVHGSRKTSRVPPLQL